MGIRLVYGLKTDDLSYLDVFYPSKRFSEAAKALGLDYGATIYAPRASFDAVAAFCKGHVALLRGELPLGLYERLEADGTVVVNSAESTARAGDKLRTAERCAAIGAAHPRTVLVDPTKTAPPLDVPFVAKPRFGKMGRGVILVESAEAWKDFLGSGAMNATEYLAQDYVEASRGRDVRFFFARFNAAQTVSTPISVVRRGAGLASNAHSGGVMERFEAPGLLKAEAERIFVDSGLVYGTVDFLFADSRGTSFVVCETNACPGFEALENLGDIDAARAILLAVAGAGGAS